MPTSMTREQAQPSKLSFTWLHNLLQTISIHSKVFQILTRLLVLNAPDHVAPYFSPIN